MKILAIETSTMLGGVAIMDDLSGLIVEVRLNVKSTYSERLMTEIDHIMEKAGLKISDIDVFAVTIGPGSFTGLRIGLSTVKGFSYATGKPIVSVPTLEALAWNFPYCRPPVCTMLDARKKEVYAALFKWDNNGFIRLINEVSIKVDRLLEKIKENNPPFIKGGLEGFSYEKIVFTGEGALLYRDKIIEVMGEKAIFASPDKMVPSPANLAHLGIKKAKKGDFSEPVSLVPIYIRRSEAEIKGNA
ncbi:MAG: tRNA (adenosine(37)-N6)-threonylcarbamoyltransferase complex dimerization subunit type 1 TsaB [Nitrospirota bacterium]